MRGFLDCGEKAVDEVRMQRWVAQEILADQAGKGLLQRTVVLPIGGGAAVVSDDDGGHAMVFDAESGRRLAGSPCGAAVTSFRLSPSGQRIAIIANEIGAVSFGEVGSGRLEWSLNKRDSMTVSMLDAAAVNEAPARIVTERQVLDVKIPDGGSWWVLSAKHHGEWLNPMNWLFAIAGHASRQSDLFVQSFAANGEEIKEWRVDSGLHMSSARFVSD